MTQPASAITTKTLKRGEVLLEAGDRLTHLYIVKSGMLWLSHGKDTASELHVATAPECVGEELAFSGTQWASTIVALKDTTVIQIPIDLAKKQLETVHPALKLWLRGLAERLKTASNEIRNARTNSAIVPCPGDHTAKLFGVIFHALREVGIKDGAIMTVDWPKFSRFALEVFQEPTLRLENGVLILVKLGYAELEHKTEDDALEDFGTLARIHFKDLVQIENFFEFFQNYHFKAGNANILKTNDKITEITQALVALAKTYRMDRNGMVTMPFKPTMDALKAKFGKGFEGDQLYRLEQKGLLVKRISTAEGGLLSFLKPEFEQMLLNWKLLKEIEAWNRKGYVSMKGYSPGGMPDLSNWKPKVLSGVVPEIRREPIADNVPTCPTCMSLTLDGQDYCEVCNADLRPKKKAS